MTQIEQYLMWAGGISILLLLCINYIQKEIGFSISLARLISVAISFLTVLVMMFFLVAHYFLTTIVVGQSINGIVPLFAVCHLFIHQLIYKD